MENMETVCVKKFDLPDIRYGGYRWCSEDEIEETKAELLEEMIDTIRWLAKKDEFWIIKKEDATNPLSSVLVPDPNNAYTVGWLATFDQMACNEDYANIAPVKKKPSIITPVFDFGSAIQAMKQGERVARQGWNGKDMYVFLAYEADFVTDADISAFDQLEVEVGDMLVMKTAQNTFQPGWLASQADMLAEDWYIVE